MSIIKEFREFAVKGNLVDMAVGLVLGVAFSKVVSSLVADIIMPPLGLILGGTDFTKLRIVLKAATPGVTDPATGAPKPEAAEVAIRYGAFISVTIDFLIVAFAMFVVVKLMNRVIAQRLALQDRAKA